MTEAERQAKLDAYVKRVLDAMPPLTDEQVNDLVTLLRAWGNSSV